MCFYAKKQKSGRTRSLYTPIAKLTHENSRLGSSWWTWPPLGLEEYHKLTNKLDQRRPCKGRKHISEKGEVLHKSS